MRFGTVAIVGRTNVGKSTFLNSVLGRRLAITSPLPQTTRDSLLGVVQHADAQIAFVDTPGLHAPKHELGRRMNTMALESARQADVIVLMTDTGQASARARKRPAPDQDPTVGIVDAADADLIGQLPSGRPCILVVNKVDLVKDKPKLLPLLDALSKRRDFEAIIPVSVKRGDGVDRILTEIVSRLPEGPAGYDADTLTDRPMTFFVREYVREQVMLQAHAEIPHAIAVSVDRFEEHSGEVSVKATIHVEKSGQRGVLIGQGGQKIKEIGTRARARLSELLDQPVHLELFIRVTERWKDMPRQLSELGYAADGYLDAHGQVPTDSGSETK